MGLGALLGDFEAVALGGATIEVDAAKVAALLSWGVAETAALACWEAAKATVLACWRPPERLPSRARGLGV